MLLMLYKVLSQPLNNLKNMTRETTRCFFQSHISGQLFIFFLEALTRFNKNSSSFRWPNLKKEKKNLFHVGPHKSY